MASTFGGISLCSTGLYTSQTNLYTTNNNISNADTVGYTKQAVNQNPGYTTTLSDGGMVVVINPDAMSIEQERSKYLDLRYWESMPSYGEWQVKSDGLNQMETILGELDETGIVSQLDSLLTSMEALSTEPQSSAPSTAVIQDVIALCDTLNNTAKQLYDMQTSVEEEIFYEVNQINQISAEIAGLNDEILNLSLSGGNASVLIDQRNLLVDELSSMMDITVSEVVVGSVDGENITSYNIICDNNLLVNEGDYQTIHAKEVTVDGIRNVELAWSGGQVYEPASGSLKGHMDLMNDSEYKGIPYYMKSLDEFTETLVSNMNAVHESGYGLDGSTGIPMFDPNKTDAMTISLSDDLLEHPEKLAMSSSPGEAGNVENLFSMIDALNDPDAFSEASYKDYISKLSTELRSETSYANNQVEGTGSLCMQIDLNRMSISGVSIDEEMTTLVYQQQIYDATAKMMNIWSEIIATTISQLGG
ncbi:flagellar hook-associated protein FlgK [Acidaminobacter sp. JC074]|uniref:flagellar hook-associated protein FlgK n=1 Tax=Acidaminobacter sp. JC074 TaxID=2530199 RepID=UPI001F10CBE3|nr:flagellar hook-associated protein FlgK [Acidaminobacter sp. JC074]